MEARGQGLRTQTLVADVAIERAKDENLTVCKSMNKKGSYSWTKSRYKVNWKEVDKFNSLVLKELSRKPTSGRIYFNECSRPKKKFKTETKVLKSDKLCFY